MANEQRKPAWWQSLPGMLTAGAAFLAALTGMLTGLKELGVFQRDDAAAPEATASVDTVVPADSALPDSSRISAEPPAPRVSRSDVRARLAKAGAQEARQGEGACVPRGGRITVTLRQELPLGPS